MTHPLSRRVFAACGAAGLGTLAASRFSLAEPPEQTLAAVGRSKGIVVGSAIRSQPSPEVAEVIARECALVTPENALKPANISPLQGRFQWDEAERTYEFARANGLGVHGHTLFWYKQPLPWAEAAASGQSLAKTVDLYADYFAAIMHRFPDTVSWDVFNEVTGTRSRLRDSFPIAQFGVDFIEAMLHRARTFAPHATLVINENDLECGSGACRTKRTNTLLLLGALRKRGAPLDAVGIQGHLNTAKSPDAGETLDFVARVEALGYDVFLSELDVNDIALGEDIRRRDDQVAELYGRFLGTVLKSKAVKRVAFWGITDAENWIAEGQTTVRSDRATPRPALFDRSMGRKPAYYAVLEALGSAPAR